MPLAQHRQVLFNPGPVNLDPIIKDNLFNVELCHRQPEFEQLQDRVRAGLLAYLGLESSHVALSLMNGSGSLAVDAGLATFVRGKVLVIDNGLYCQRLARTLSMLSGAEVDVISFGVGVPFDLVAIEEVVVASSPDWIAMVHHETTTGILNPLDAVAQLCRRYGVRLFVDAVSSLGAHEVNRDADVVCFNSAKCLESLTGIAAILWKRDLQSYPTVPVLDVTSYAHGMPSTPHVQAMIALDMALDILASEDRPARYRRLAAAVWANGSRHFEPMLDEENRSWVLTSFRLGGRDPDLLFARALEHGYVIYHGQQELRSQIFRVANMGAAMNEEVIHDLFRVLSS
jgi:2-aminoethylphosphonate-pyruvate transaminase